MQRQVVRDGEPADEPGDEPGPGSWSLPAFLAGGVLASILIVAGGLEVGPRLVATNRTTGAAWGFVLVYAGLALLLATWLLVGRAVAAGVGPSPKNLCVLLAAWSTPLLYGPPLFTRDPYSYAAQGKMVVVGLNPYHHGTFALGQGPFLRAVSPIWRHTPVPYGPLFVGLEGLVVRWLGTLEAAAYGMRALAVVGVALMAVYVPRLASRFGADPGYALWLGVLNPLVLLHFVSGGHNEALMIGLLAMGLVVALEGRPNLGLVVCALAVMVKAPAALGIVLLVAQLARSTPDRRWDWRVVWRSAAVVLSTFVATTAVAGVGWGWVTTLNTPGKVRNLLSVTTGLGTFFGQVAEWVGLTGSSDWAIAPVRSLGLLAASAILVLTYLRLERWGLPRALGVGLLAVVVLGPVVQPWYLMWGITMLAAAGVDRWTPVLVWLSAGSSLLILPSGTSARDVVLAAFLAVTAVVVALNVNSPRRLLGIRADAARPAPG